MKANIFDIEGKKLKEIELPVQFSEEYRPDLIKRAVLVVQANKRQSYGAFPKAGQRASAVLSRRRRDFRGAYGYGISRVPRKILWRRGTQFGWQGAFAPGTVKGRKAHPPKSTKILAQKINIKERRKAIRSALAATTLKDIVTSRGHSISKLLSLPLIVEKKFESLTKTKDVKATLEKIGLKEELQRINTRKIRAGKGKSRGRKYKTKKGPLIVVSENCSLEKSAKNILGIDICKVNLLNTELLAPGTVPGRLTIFTENSIDKLKNEKLFLNVKKEKTEKKPEKKIEAKKEKVKIKK